ncbi:DNA polymerase III subunit gamma and tau [Amycolatopsis albispora]|uniref:DNA polymerase III subunit gamma/tau n=1 Tax=Amycolatopsis albispora TaxID=1804986 RepID=A0A344LCI6_9PSEU|nr:DNA polymerase III subunit gamma and tau [Amycolatopsis albispora]AXB45760.1 DNA polymerase III subunit gamma/tau [Amycolatopsis albispora]
MALALYRKYRPATFAEVVGQEHVTEPLRTALAAGRINHAYLFSGPRGCGKTSSARIMARSLNCEQGPTPDPCGECGSCRALAPEGSGSIDVTELDAASHGGVEDARELRDRAFYAPAESRYRVFIIDEAHMVTTQGFNALLKIVEEPPEHLIFIFATTEPDKVLTTIRSRTHHYPFRLIPPSAMRELLERNVAAEGVPVEPAVYPLVIRAGGGSARDTQSVLDQLLAGAGPDGVTYERAVSLLGVTDVALIDDMVEGLAADDSTAVFGTVERLAEAGHDPRRFASDLLDRLRDLVVLRSVPDAAARGLVAAPEDELNRMVAQAERAGLATLSRYAEIVHNGLLEMRGATAPRLLLELLCARMLLPSAADGEAALLQRLERLERRVTVGGAPDGTAAAASPGTASPGGAASGGAERFQRPSQRQAAGASAAPAAAQPSAEAPSRPAPGQQASAASALGQQAPPAQQAPAASAPGQQPPAASAPAQQAPAAAPPAQPPTHPSGGQPSGGQAPAAQPPAPAASRQPVGQASGQQSGGQAGGQPQSGPSAAAQPSGQQGAAAGGMDAAAVRRVWPELLAAIRKIPGGRSTEAMLTQAGVQSVDGTSVVLTHTAEPLARRLADPHNSEKIASALRDVLGGEWRVTCVHGNAAAKPQPVQQQRQAPPQQAAEEKRFRRPSEGRPAPEPAPPAPPEPPRPKVTTAEPDIPLPPEPEDEEEYLDAATTPPPPNGSVPPPPPPPTPQVDEAEEKAHRLLSEQLGARPLD